MRRLDTQGSASDEECESVGAEATEHDAFVHRVHLERNPREAQVGEGNYNYPIQNYASKTVQHPDATQMRMLLTGAASPSGVRVKIYA